MEESGQMFKWLFDDTLLRNTPSVKDGIRHEQELVFRQKQAMLMQAIGQKSGLTQLAINTSVIFMHRFYMYRKIKFMPRIHIAIGFVFAAGKVEESARKLEHLIRYTVDILRNNKNGEFLDKRDKLTYEMDCEWRDKIELLCQNNCDVTSSAYEEMRKNVLECEAEIYAVIGFQLQITHPHKFVIRMSGLLGAENRRSTEKVSVLYGGVTIAENIKDISQYAYNLATVSSQLTMLNLKYKPELIATVCLNIASKAHSVKFMCMKDPSIKWYQVYDPTTEIKEIETVTEEFLGLIKACQLLPSWMTNLAKAPPRSNSRGQPVATKSTMGAAHSTGHPYKPLPPVASTGSHHPPSASHVREVSKPAPPQSSSLPVSSDSLSSQSNANVTTSSPASSVPQGDGGSSSKAIAITSSSHPSSSQSSHRASGSTNAADPHSIHHHHREGRPPHPSASASSIPRQGSSNRHHPHQMQHQQHQRSHPNAPRSNSHHNPVPPSGSNRPSSSNPQPSSSRSTSSRPPNQPNLPHASRPDYPRRPDRPDIQESRRSQIQPNLDESNHKHPTPPPVLENVNANNASISSQQRSSEMTKTTPPPTPITPPEPPSHHLLSNDSLSHGPPVDFLASPSESNNGAQPVDPNKLRLANQSSKLSLSSYRERFGSKLRPSSSASQNDSVTDDSGIQTGASEENYSLDVNNSAVDSPANSSVPSAVSNPDMAGAFSVPQDSPTNPRLKLKVKRDPVAGDKHSVKYADSGLKIKIKQPRITEVKEDDVAGPSGYRSGTPIEEGEVVDSPSSTGSSDRKSEGSLKIRLNIPKSGGSGEPGTNGFGGESSSDHSSGHRSHHHHSHRHRSHHHSHKSKKHKQDSSRHEGKSSKRSAEYHEQRPSKSARMDSVPSESRSVPSHRGSLSLQHQVSGFSINDAFSSTMPSNIFDDDDDDLTQAVPPPITPTTDTYMASSGDRAFRGSSSRKSSSQSVPEDGQVPAHHQRFHQLMAQHRANEARKPPLPPLPASNHPPPPPPPPPPAF